MCVLLEICRPYETTSLSNPLDRVPTKVSFPFQTDDFLDDILDMNQELVKNKDATFYARIISSSTEKDFSEGDVLVVDRSLPLQNNKMAVCFMDGNFTLRKIHLEGGTLWLEALNSALDAIRITVDNQYMVWGMVTYIVKRTW